MKSFEIEQLICKDIDRQLEEAERDERSGYHEAALHRAKTVKGFCENLIARLDERIKEEGGKQR